MRIEEVIAEALTNGSYEVSLEALLEDIDSGLPEAPFLERVAALERKLADFRLEFVPSLTVGDEKRQRIIRPIKLPPYDQVALQREIGLGESSEREFKSSLYFDRKRAKADKDASGNDLKSEKVLFSSLKTVAAFLNSDGGTLLLGVKDDGTIAGINDDFDYCGGPDVDSFELHLRSLIDGRFLAGSRINDYVRIGFVQDEDCLIARVVVDRRGEVAYLRASDGRYRVYRRQGNRTVEVPIEELLDWVRLRERQE